MVQIEQGATCGNASVDLVGGQEVGLWEIKLIHIMIKRRML